MAEAEKQPLTAMVDYLRVSFKHQDEDRIIQNVLGIKKAFMIHEERAFYGYVGTYALDFIRVLYSIPGDAKGTLIELSGQGCRQYETFLKGMKKTWFDFFQQCLQNGGTFTRLDIAIDDHKPYFSLLKIRDKIERQECTTRFKKIVFHSSVNSKDWHRGGHTIYFGSRKSDVHICFYEKNYEQAEKWNLPLEDFGEWNRYEIRMKDQRAQEAIRHLVDRQDFKGVAMEVINNYLRFVEARDVHRRYWDTSLFWQTFVEDFGHLRLFVEPAQDFYEKSLNWMKNYCAPTMKMVWEKDRILGTNDLMDMIQFSDMGKRQEKMLDVFVTDIDDMMIRE
ncbi:replication initiation factor domain-containing protein [Salicibibacter cibarius]|uniref:Replication initiation factor domain-containing protein n=1 Tax=Salicibibacter cibarius TaxID=2743000 RepID=A0A7T7CAY7_9BACI|nr:replication initiation factor domain-containing protein [Salicibibacter cibarius]QQK75392.1 replication initiation factor domain-containing protein [Salicibibacter cibarius]